MALGGGAAAEDVQIEVGGDSTGLQNAIAGGIERLNDFKTAVGIAGAAVATFAAKQLSNAVSASEDFEQAMADVKKVTDPQVAAEMGDEIQRMASRIPLAHDELAALATQAGRMGAEGTEEVSKFTETAASMASATVLTAEEAGTALGKMSSALGESLGDVGPLADAINEVSNNFQTDSAEIVDSAQRSGQALRAMGMESENIIGLSGAFNEVSPNAQMAAQRMQQVSESMMDPENVDMFADALGVTSDEFTNMRNENPEETMLSLMDAVDEGTLSWETLSEHLTNQQARAFRDSAEASDRMREAMELSNQAAEEGKSVEGELAAETDTLAGQKALLANRIQNLYIQMGDNLLPIIRAVVDRIIVAVDWFAEINRQTDGWAGTLAGLVGIVGGVAAAASALIGALGGIAAVKGTLIAMATPLATAIGGLTAPILAVVAAVGLLAAAFATDFAGIRTLTEEVAQALREALQPAIDWFKSDGVPIIQMIKEAVLTFVDAAEPYIARFAGIIADVLIVSIKTLATVFGTAFGVITDVITTAWNSVLKPFLEWSGQMWDEHLSRPVNEAAETLGLAWEKISEELTWLQNEVIDPILTWFDEKTGKTLGRISDWWDKHGDTVMAIVEFLFSNLKALVEGSIATISDIFSAFFALLRADWDAVRENILSIVQRLVDGIYSVFEWLYNALIGGSLIPDMFNAITSFLLGWIDTFISRTREFLTTVFNLYMEFLNRIYDFIIQNLTNSYEFWKGILTDIYGVTSDLFTKIFQFIDQTLQKIFQTIDSVLESIFGEFDTGFTDIYNAATDFGSDLVSWISDTASDFLQNVKDLASDVVSEFDDLGSDSLGKLTSMASDFKSAGKDLIGEFVSGIKSKASDVGSAVSSVASEARDKLPFSPAKEGPLDDIDKTGPALVDEVASGMTDNLRRLSRAASRVAEAARPHPDGVSIPLDAIPAQQGAGDSYREGDTYDIDVVIEGDADERDVRNGLSSALKAFNVD